MNDGKIYIEGDEIKRDWRSWLWEKSEGCVSSVSRIYDELNKTELPDEFKENLESYLWNVLRYSLLIYSFSSNSPEWSNDSDAEIIIQGGHKGFNEIKRKYDASE
jgi:hypothetical protein